jgi:hypothetical protein
MSGSSLNRLLRELAASTRTRTGTALSKLTSGLGGVPAQAGRVGVWLWLGWVGGGGADDWWMRKLGFFRVGVSSTVTLI